MPRKSKGPSGHTGRTESGNIRDVKVEKIGPVTIYKRGLSYSLYYREAGKSRRTKVDGNLAVARATASSVASALANRRPSPIGHQRTTPEEMVSEFLSYVSSIQKLALRTQDRYRAALDRFLDFSRSAGIAAVDAVDTMTVEDFVRWMRGQTRTRNGSARGKRGAYKVGGVKFVLSTCRTAFQWAGRRRMLPPFTENPFRSFPIDKLRDRAEGNGEPRVFSAAQEKAFFDHCSDWQRSIFISLATYGLRVGELAHLLVEDVDFEAGVIEIVSKPELFWHVKSGRRRKLPLSPDMRNALEQLIGGRTSGFVFLNEKFFRGRQHPALAFASPRAFKAHVQKIAESVTTANPEAKERDLRRSITAFCRTMGQIPEKRIRHELMKLTEAIGCPEFTRAHDLRHLFASRAQEAGMNPLLVQDMLGHATMDMTRRYTHFGL
jgi:integrase